MKWRNSKERELLASGGSRSQTLPTKSNPHPDLSDSELERAAAARSSSSSISTSTSSFIHHKPTTVIVNGAATCCTTTTAAVDQLH
jgi:hypothetical protein